MCRAIADGIDIGQRSAAEIVDVDPVSANGSRVDQWLHCGDDADADNHYVGRHHLAPRQLHASDFFIAKDALDRDARA